MTSLDSVDFLPSYYRHVYRPISFCQSSQTLWSDFALTLKAYTFPFFLKTPKRLCARYEGLPGVLGNKGTLAKYRREQGNISQFLGTGEQNSKNYSTKTFGKCVRTWEHRAILEGNKGTRTPPGRPSDIVRFYFQSAPIKP